MVLNIDDEYLKELLEYSSKSLVGKLLKRFEIIDDKETIKRDAKELIYEQFRQLRDLVHAHNRGLGMTQFVFKTKGDSTPQQ